MCSPKGYSLSRHTPWTRRVGLARPGTAHLPWANKFAPTHSILLNMLYCIPIQGVLNRCWEFEIVRYTHRRDVPATVAYPFGTNLHVMS